MKKPEKEKFTEFKEIETESEGVVGGKRQMQAERLQKTHIDQCGFQGTRCSPAVSPRDVYSSRAPPYRSDEHL